MHTNRSRTRGIVPVTARCRDRAGTSQRGTTRAVDAAGRNPAQVAAAMAEEISRFLSEPARLATLSASAIANLRHFITA
jgi:hypothetical protein